jgi:hypothetical protein
MPKDLNKLSEAGDQLHKCNGVGDDFVANEEYANAIANSFTIVHKKKVKLCP